MFSLFVSIIFLMINNPSVHQQAEAFFNEKPKGYDEIKIEFLNIPENAASIKFLTEEIDETKSIITIPAEIKFNDGKISKRYLSIKLHLFKNVLTAKQDIERNSRLSEENFIQRRIQVNDLNKTPIVSFNEIKNCSAKFRISRGAILFKEDLQKTPVVTAGERVTANLYTKSTTISFPAYARQDGAIDDYIRIITEDNKLFKARVLDSLNVSIIE